MSLLHHYTFSESSDRLFDMTQNNFHLLKVDTQQTADAKWGTSTTRLFNSSIVNPQVSYSPFYGDSFSICVWIRYNNIGSGQELISGVGSNIVITLEVISSGAINFGLGSGESPDDLTFKLQTPANIVPTNEWVNIIAVWDKPNEVAKVYVAGELVGTLNFASSPLSVEDDWQLGRRYDDTEKLEANINDLKIFDHALSDYEIRMYGKSASMEIRANTMHIWEIDETLSELKSNGVVGFNTDFVEEDTTNVEWVSSGIKTQTLKEGF